LLRALWRLVARRGTTAHPAGDAPTPDADDVKVVLGLGNPGRDYEDTRHNVGWWVVDHLADVWAFEKWRKDGEALVTQGQVGRHRVRLVKPLTYMNLSGQVLRPYLRRPFWSAKTDLLVVVDEVALPVGTFRIRAQGSAGGHNGLKSVEHHLKSQQYPRLRVGIHPADPRRRGSDLADFVLSPFGRDEREEVVALLPSITAAVERWLTDGAEAAMSEFNKKQQA
jgi:PTH1 family peptidyl-tRNA hydrolase